MSWKIQKVIFPAAGLHHLKHLQLQLEKFSEHEITLISFTDDELFTLALLRTTITHGGLASW